MLEQKDENLLSWHYTNDKSLPKQTQVFGRELTAQKIVKAHNFQVHEIALLVCYKV
jgi:hypothetical protein